MSAEERIHRAEVCDRYRAGPRMIGLRVRIGDGFASNGLGDEYVRLHIPDRAPVAAADRLPREGSAPRYYTIRSWDASSELADILFLSHGHGRAATWAERVSQGARMHVSLQRGGYRPHEGAGRSVLAGDATALPAIARILEQDANPATTALVQVEHASERGTATTDPRVRWLVAGHGERALAAALRERGVAPDDYVWFSGEAAEMRTVRRWLRHELGVPPGRYLTMGYWRADSDRLRARMRALPPEAAEELERIWASGLPGEEQRDLADDAMRRWGMEDA